MCPLVSDLGGWLGRESVGRSRQGACGSVGSSSCFRPLSPAAAASIDASDLCVRTTDVGLTFAWEKLSVAEIRGKDRAGG